MAKQPRIYRKCRDGTIVVIEVTVQVKAYVTREVKAAPAQGAQGGQSRPYRSQVGEGVPALASSARRAGERTCRRPSLVRHHRSAR